MSRLQDIVYNENQWIINGSRKDGYKIVNKRNGDINTITGDVIGIEQISSDTFLIHKRMHYSLWQISRIKIKERLMQEEFSKEFKHFEFLTDDTILFDNSKVYSIKDNAYVSVFNKFARKDITIYEILDGKKIICIKSQIICNQLPGLYDIVFIDAESFKPVTQAFSSLRNQLITLSDNFTFEDLEVEDDKYAHIIGDYFFEENQQNINKGKDTLLSQFQLMK